MLGCRVLQQPEECYCIPRSVLPQFPCVAIQFVRLFPGILASPTAPSKFIATMAEGCASIVYTMATWNHRGRIHGTARGTVLAAVAIGLGMAACGSAPPRVEATAPKAESGSKRVAAPPSGPQPRFSLSHWPWHGMRTTVEVLGDGDTKSLRVYRSIDPQYLATWKVQLTDSGDAKALEELMTGLTSGAASVHSCPRPQGSDGALWIARGFAAKADAVADFRVEGGPECGRYEDLAVKLMQLAKVECGFAACIRTEELQAGKFSCALGSEGDQCRDPSNEQSSIPRELLKGLRR